MDVRQIAQEIVAREGGYVNDPDDPGGATKYGVTIGTMRRLGLDLTGDGQVDPRDVAALSPSEAVEIFVRDYYQSPGINQLPPAIQTSVFDMYVNAGRNAVKLLQKLLSDMGQMVEVDGVIGPKTIEAAETCAALAPDHLADAYGIARRNYYFDIADATPKLRKFARTRAGLKGGWIKRAEEFISARYHLTAEEFQARVVTWG